MLGQHWVLWRAMATLESPYGYHKEVKLASAIANSKRLRHKNQNSIIKAEGCSSSCLTLLKKAFFFFFLIYSNCVWTPGQALLWSSSERCLARGLKLGTCRSVTLGGVESLAGTRTAEVTSAAPSSLPGHRLCLPRQVQRQISSTEMQPGRSSPVFLFCCSPRDAGERQEGEVDPGFAHLRTTEECVRGTSRGENTFRELPPPLQRL